MKNATRNTQTFARKDVSPQAVRDPTLPVALLV